MTPVLVKIEQKHHSQTIIISFFFATSQLRVFSDGLQIKTHHAVLLGNRWICVSDNMLLWQRIWGFVFNIPVYFFIFGKDASGTKTQEGWCGWLVSIYISWSAAMLSKALLQMGPVNEMRLVCPFRISGPIGIRGKNEDATLPEFHRMMILY